jgi:hypothetical protein
MTNDDDALTADELEQLARSLAMDKSLGRHDAIGRVCDWCLPSEIRSGIPAQRMLRLGRCYSIGIRFATARNGRGGRTGRTRMRKLIASATIVAVGMTIGGTAFAGEINGSGDHGNPDKGNQTPINSYQAGSICSFSGLNDDPSGGGDPFQDGKVQNWGKVLEDAKALIGDGDNGANELAHMIHTEGPGTNCRGYASGG